jgi:hypothetical protein
MSDRLQQHRRSSTFGMNYHVCLHGARTVSGGIPAEWDGEAGAAADDRSRLGEERALGRKSNCVLTREALLGVRSIPRASKLRANEELLVCFGKCKDRD